MTPWLLIVVVLTAAFWALQRGDGARSRPGAWAVPVAIIAAALAVLLLPGLWMPSAGGGGWMGGHMNRGGATTSSAEVVEGVREIEIEAGELWFEPGTVEVPAGEPVSLRLVNTGETFHDLTIPAADLVLAAEPGEETVGTIELAQPGRYELTCSVPGHAQGGMRGTIVVSDT